MRICLHGHISIGLSHKELEFIDLSNGNAIPDEFYQYSNFLELCPEDVLKSLQPKTDFQYNGMKIYYHIKPSVYLRFNLSRKTKVFIHSIKQALKYMELHESNMNADDVHAILNDFNTRNYTATDDWITYINQLKDTWRTNKHYIEICDQNQLYFYAILLEFKRFCNGIRNGTRPYLYLSEECYPELTYGNDYSQRDHDTILSLVRPLSPTSETSFNPYTNYDNSTIQYQNDEDLNRLEGVVNEGLAKWDGYEMVPEWFIRAEFRDMIEDYNTAYEYGFFYQVDPVHYANTSTLNELLARYHIEDYYEKIVTKILKILHKHEETGNEPNFDKLLQYVSFIINSYSE